MGFSLSDRLLCSVHDRFRWPTGASGNICLSWLADGGAAGFREPAVCAIATEVSTRASNAIVVINFLMMGLPSWGPLMVNGNGKLDHKVRQSSRFVQMLRARAMPRCPRHAYRHRGKPAAKI